MLNFLGFLILITPVALFIALTGENYGIPAWVRIVISYLGITFITLCFVFGLRLLSL
jgi:hypothetical protein